MTSATSDRTLRRQGRETRDRLLDAAVEALGAHGYQAARVDDVVDVAGVSHGSFYLYFSNKEELFAALAQRCAAEMQLLADRLATADLTDLVAVRAWVVEFLALYRSHGVVIRAWAEGQVVDPALVALGRASFARMTDALAPALAPTAPGAPALRTAALLGMIERSAYLTDSRDVGIGDEVVADTLARLMVRGFFVRR